MSIEVKVVGGDNLEVSLLGISSIAGIETGSSVVQCRTTGDEEITITLEEFCKLFDYIMKGGNEGWSETPMCVKESISRLCAKIL